MRYGMPPLSRQRGLATLLIAVVMLIVLAFITLYSNRAIFIEQRTTTNQYKRTLALEAAQSGIDGFMGTLGGTDTSQNFNKYFQKSGGNWQLKTNYDNASKLNSAGYLNSSNSAYNHDFGQTGLKTADSGTLPLPKDAGGNNIDGFAQTYTVYLATLGTNRFRMISRGCADACDYAEAFVMIDFTISGGAICPMDVNGTLNISTSGGSSIHGFTNNVKNSSGSDAYTCGVSVGTQGTGSFSDVIGCVTQCNNSSSNKYDPPYEITGGVSKDTHFQNYFGTDINSLKASSSTSCLLGAAGTDSNFSAVQTSINTTCAGKKYVFIQGNLVFDSQFANVGLNRTPPMVLIVEGNLSMPNPSPSTLFGTLYVRGDAVSNIPSSLTINGSAAFAGNLSTNGTISVYATSPYSVIPSSSATKPSTSANSWRDF
ncbi:pilus assembly PilX family protein [Chitinilyticum piscinae]|uniref:Type 4 fimbrial biogenesis protein PilX N-terminal domain-containing protein n=1 Tax=Chitinilyticum piscinae TaxID=2866724 RepID=A0A8J7G2H4_9NEIS|nr:hypothetical protein [Chitinilyticum piscinae]MBE9610790.1 hypothetical protein [Chitinilyticum piscinae]